MPLLMILKHRLLKYIAHQINKIKSQLGNGHSLSDEERKYLDIVDRDAQIITALFGPSESTLCPRVWIDDYLGDYAKDMNSYEEMSGIFQDTVTNEV